MSESLGKTLKTEGLKCTFSGTHWDMAHGTLALILQRRRQVAMPSHPARPGRVSKRERHRSRERPSLAPCALQAAQGTCRHTIANGPFPG